MPMSLLDGQGASDQFGKSVASAGDFNGDGKDDVIVGAYFDDNNSQNTSGSAFIFFGGITGTKRADADADVIIDGQNSGDQFGISVASAGDFNGDGTSDVIVGAHIDDNNSTSKSGSAFVFFSSGVFPSITFSDSTSSQKENTTSVTIPVTLSKTSSSTVTINYTVTSTATGGGVDFTLASGTLSFSAGTTSQNISFSIVNDSIVEDAETITITLSSPTEAIFVTSNNKIHTFTILNDDNSLFSSKEGRADDTRYSSRLAISPYAQVIPNDSYTFIGVSHPSLDSALTQIGLVVEVIDMKTTLNNAVGRAVMFTIDAGETHRIFVVNQSHPTLNNINPIFLTNPNMHLIQTVDSAQFGQVRATTVSERPGLPAGSRSVRVGDTYKFDSLSQLSMWGAIYMESTGGGFAMEFIGDMHDSTLGGLANAGSTLGEANGNNALPRPMRGIN